MGWWNAFYMARGGGGAQILGLYFLLRSVCCRSVPEMSVSRHSLSADMNAVSLAFEYAPSLRVKAPTRARYSQMMLSSDDAPDSSAAYPNTGPRARVSSRSRLRLLAQGLCPDRGTARCAGL